MSDNRKPCQKCASDHLQFERWIDEEYKTRYRVLCSACTYTPDHWEEDAEKAVVYWNTRPLEDAANARAEKAEAEASDLRAALADANEDAAALDAEVVALLGCMEPGKDYDQVAAKHNAHRARVGGGEIGGL